MLQALYRYTIPLAKPLVLASADRQLTLTHREGLLLRWRHRQGFSECAPLPLFSNETLTDCELALSQYFYHGTEPAESLISARFAIEMGHFSLPQTKQPVALAGFAQSQQRVIKIKCGAHAFQEDLNHIAQLVKQGKRLRIDCNQRWSLQELQQCYRLFKPAIDYFEEPLARQHWPDYQQLSLPFALDEQLRQQQLPSYAYKANTWVIKPMLTGLANTLTLAEHAKAQGINLVLSSAHESSVSIEFYHNLARHLGLSTPQGLDTLSLLTQAIQPSWLSTQPDAKLEQLC